MSFLAKNPAKAKFIITSTIGTTSRKIEKLDTVAQIKTYRAGLPADRSNIELYTKAGVASGQAVKALKAGAVLAKATQKATAKAAKLALKNAPAPAASTSVTAPAPTTAGV